MELPRVKARLSAWTFELSIKKRRCLGSGTFRQRIDGEYARALVKGNSNGRSGRTGIENIWLAVESRGVAVKAQTDCDRDAPNSETVAMIESNARRTEGSKKPCERRFAE